MELLTQKLQGGEGTRTSCDSCVIVLFGLKCLILMDSVGNDLCCDGISGECGNSRSNAPEAVKVFQNLSSVGRVSDSVTRQSVT